MSGEQPTEPTELAHDLHAGGHGEEAGDEIWGHKKKKRRRRKHTMPGENVSELNLTPMMDIMTILLVFLIQSFANEPSNINVTLDMRPPATTSKVNLEAATRVTITAKEILVEDEVVARLDSLGLKPGQKELPMVRDALIERADNLKKLENMGGSPFDGKLNVIADEKTPYSLITAVLYSAGQAKFGSYRLVLMPAGGAE